MEIIKLIDSINPQDAVVREVSQNYLLNTVIKLQNQPSLESLLSTFEECIQSIHSISGVRYRYPLLAISHQIGIQSKSQINLHLEQYNEFLGDITIYHDEPIHRTKVKSFELITSLLIHPLRAIINNKTSSSFACNDEAIGVANAELVEQLVTREAKLAQREHVEMTLILANIDRFKRITEKHDLVTRDEVLYQVLKVMLNNIRDTDLLFRYKGDTYCLILKGVITKDALLISERIRNAVDEHQFNRLDSTAKHITISSGIAKLEKYDSIESIFTRATQAMLHAKKIGRNQSVVADNIFKS